MRDDGRRACRAPSARARRAGRSRSGSVCRRYSAVSSPAAAPPAICAVRRPSSAGSENPGRRGRQRADLGEAAAVRAGRDAQQAGALARAGELEPARDVEQRAGGVVGARAGEQPLAVEDHDVLAGVGEQVGERVDGAGLGAGRLGEAADLVAARLAGGDDAERGVERAEQRLAGARGEAGAAAWRSRRATTGGSRRPRASRRGGARPCGCAGRGSGRRRPARSRGRRRRGRTRGRATVACSGRARRARAGGASDGPPAARESMSCDSRPSRTMRWRRKPSSFVVSPPTTAPTRPLARLQPRRGLAQRALPGDRAQLAAVADHRPR